MVLRDASLWKLSQAGASRDQPLHIILRDPRAGFIA